MWGDIPGELKQEYRKYYLKQDIKQARITMMVMFIPVVCSGFLDFFLLGPGLRLILSILGRCLFFSYTLFLIVKLNKTESIKFYDTSTLIWLIAGSAFLLIGGALRPATYSGHTIVYIVMLVFMYFGIPNRLSFWAVAGSICTLFILFTLVFIKDSTGISEIMDSSLALLAVTAAGIFINYRIYSYKRSHFMAYHRVSELASRDSLTGILNRRAFLERAENEMKRFQRYVKPFCIILMDLDEFKSINDTYGHLEGDAVLKKFTTMVSSEIRKSDSFGRIGGEEFCIILPGTTQEEAREIAWRIGRKCAEAGIHSCEGIPVSFSVSTGIAEAGPNDSIDSMMHRADMAMYEAKKAGQNGLVEADARLLKSS